MAGCFVFICFFDTFAFVFAAAPTTVAIVFVVIHVDADAVVVGVVSGVVRQTQIIRMVCMVTSKFRPTPSFPSFVATTMNSDAVEDLQQKYISLHPSAF